ncbi:hypothetical protein BT69DRAFT_1347351 [Atractiella rhizophila]|nr:hypothetical protein BT69DRAFT_1347351 [Atractiella rhizophila]
MLTLILTTLVSVASAAVKTQYAYPNGLGDVFQYKDALPIHDYTTVALPVVPEICQQYAQNGGDPLCTATMSAVAATIDDCSEPWTVCRCSDAQMSFTQLLDKFARMPVHLRDHVRTLLAFNGSRSAFSNEQDMAIFGDCSDEAGLSVFVHEAGHDIDQGVSVSTAWTNALAADTCVPDPYGGVSVQEDFAQVTVITLYLYLYGAVPSGSISCMDDQVSTFEANPRLNKNIMIGKKVCDLTLRSQWGTSLSANSLVASSTSGFPIASPVSTPIFNAEAVKSKRDLGTALRRERPIPGKFQRK